MRSVALLSILMCSSIPVGSAQPSDVTFTLTTTKDPPIYHFGEQIICKLSFSVQSRGKYEIVAGGIDDTGSEFRSPFGPPEIYSATPADGVVDPDVKLGQYGFVAVGSILSGRYTLSATPRIVQEDLNQWLRFTRAGDYRVRARSSRLVRSDSPTDPATHISLQSNDLRIVILPADAVWSSGELHRITAVLESSTSTDQSKTLAVRRLRYLNTVPAVNQMAGKFSESMGQPWHNEYYQGLLETTQRAAAIQALQDTIRNPQNRVSYDVVELLATLVLISDYSKTPLPPYSVGSPVQRRDLQSSLQQRQNRYNVLWAKYTVELSASLPARIGRPRADAVFALWKNAEMHQRSLPL